MTTFFVLAGGDGLLKIGCRALPVTRFVPAQAPKVIRLADLGRLSVVADQRIQPVDGLGKPTLVVQALRFDEALTLCRGQLGTAAGQAQENAHDGHRWAVR